MLLFPCGGTEKSSTDRATTMRSTTTFLLLCLLALPAFLAAFLVPTSPASSSISRGLLSERPIQSSRSRSGFVVRRKMSEEVEEESAVRKLDLANNLRSRKGRTTDEDGKSNIWAIESKTEVEVSGGSGAFVVVGVLVAFIGALALLPTLQFPTYD